MVHLHSQRTGSDEEEHHHHVSIASLRSKFESLAHGKHDPPKPPSSDKASAVAAQSLAPVSDAPPRVPSPKPQASSAPASAAPAPPEPSSRPLPTISVPLVNPQLVSNTPAQSSRPPPAASLSTDPPKSTLSKTPPPRPPPMSKPPSAVPSSSSPPPVVPTVVKPAPPKPTANRPEPTPTQAKPAESEDGEEEGFQSVQALRQRFGSAASVRPPVRPSVEPSVSVEPTVQPQQVVSEPPTRSSTMAFRPPMAHSASLTDADTATGTIPLSSSPSPPTLRPVNVSNKPPPPKPPISRSNSPAPPEAVPAPTLAPAPLAAAAQLAPDAPGSRSNSPAVGHRPAPPPPVSRSQLVASPAGSRATSPVPGHRPAPPPPPPQPPRVPSPSLAAAPVEPTPVVQYKPPLPVRKATLPPSVSDSNIVATTMPTLDPSSGPPPIPGNRPKALSNASSTSLPPPLPQKQRPVIALTTTPVETPLTVPQPSLPPPPVRTPGRPADISSQATAGSQPPPLPTSKRPEGSATTPSLPPLPVRRPTLPDAMPAPPPAAPPLPGNKPAAPLLTTTKSLTRLSSSPEPPPVSYRPRAATVSRDTASVTRATTPPRLPVRRSSVAVGGDDEGYQPPPPPMRSIAPSAPPAPSTSLHRSNTTATAGASVRRNNTTATLHRNGTTRASGATTPRRDGSGGGESDEEEDSGAQLTTMAQRLLDEHPDSTQANRRPPQFSPHIKVETSQSISAFTAFGRYVCVSHNTVKVFDTQMTEQPILNFDPKDTGMESRAKDPRVTALRFRPSSKPENRGRYLWCGNKDGHIWELDIHTGEVTATKPSIHSAAVTYIMYHKLAMITIDELGKLHVWETPDHDGEGQYKITRTLRISDKVTFAKMIKGHLWTATAPAVRSATNTTGARGPTVRVYDLTAEGSVPPPLVALTTEWTGAATSATLVPLSPENGELVYIGHEGGFVSLWSTEQEQLICHQVLKVSQTDILSLEGVGDRLWAGNRRGQIHVWNIMQKPWLTTNIWTAHDEQPIHTLSANPSAIATTGRYMLWSCSRDSVNAWDGLLAVDWIYKRMVARQEDYCDFRNIRVLVCSWNIDSSRPTDLVGSPENVTFLDQVLQSVESPDIIVFGFQEVVPLTDKKLTAKTLLFGHKGKDGGGATNDRVSERYRAWADKLAHAVRLARSQETPYVKVHSEQLVGLFTCMFVKQSEREALRDVSIKTVKRGIGGIYGNKGAIVARMVMDDTSMCFINVHLAAGQSHRAARTADLAAIMEDKAIFPAADKLPYVNGGNGTGILDHEMVILNGDLNYRIDQRREVVISSIRSGDLDFLLEHDQLRKEMRGNHAFRLRNFTEPPIYFAPTYKYDPGTNNYDSSDKRRIPAWCDRVLFLKNPRVTPLNYQRYEITCSDHKPVSAGLGMEIKRIDPDRMRAIHKEVVQEWTRLEATLLAEITAAYAKFY